MKNLITTALIFALMSIVLPQYVYALTIKEGAWDMTTVIKTPGMDEHMAEAKKEMEKMDPSERAMMEKMMGGMGMKMGMEDGGMSISMSQCLTNSNPVPKGKDEGDDCKVTHTIKGNTVEFESICPESRSTGKIVYKDDTMKGNIKNVTTIKGKEETTMIDISGTYTGPCDGSETINSDEMSKKSKGMKQKFLDFKK